MRVTALKPMVAAGRARDIGEEFDLDAAEARRLAAVQAVQPVRRKKAETATVKPEKAVR